MTDTRTDVDKVIFVSESCLPAVPLSDCLSLLGEDRHSWLKYSSESDNGFTYQKQVSTVLCVQCCVLVLSSVIYYEYIQLHTYTYICIHLFSIHTYLSLSLSIYSGNRYSSEDFPRIVYTRQISGVY